MLLIGFRNCLGIKDIRADFDFTYTPLSQNQPTSKASPQHLIWPRSGPVASARHQGSNMAAPHDFPVGGTKTKAAEAVFAVNELLEIILDSLPWRCRMRLQIVAIAWRDTVERSLTSWRTACSCSQDPSSTVWISQDTGKSGYGWRLRRKGPEYATRALLQDVAPNAIYYHETKPNPMLLRPGHAHSDATSTILVRKKGLLHRSRICTWRGNRC